MGAQTGAKRNGGGAVKSEITIQLRAFPLLFKDKQTGAKSQDMIVLTKGQLQAAQVCGQSSKELIERLCERQGRQLLEIGKPERRELTLDLQEEYSRRWCYAE